MIMLSTTDSKSNLQLITINFSVYAILMKAFIFLYYSAAAEAWYHFHFSYDVSQWPNDS